MRDLAVANIDVVGPRLCRGVRLAYDGVRDAHVLLAPESVLVLNETAAAIVARCDGATPVAAIVADLGAAYRGVRAEEVSDMLTSLVNRYLIDEGTVPGRPGE
ncbi:pyrroloquinoline quinone biosynthesis protein D [Streptomyces sp. 846.5]|nr:pyrroloquinoline quinone biosynthesis peptide chaperone PqqD [Streptomyces sp. 846.5]TDT94082.1 pyrroloquinoline quinone biosynthesis protein D [Streptomyces sp. 846.5]